MSAPAPGAEPPPNRSGIPAGKPESEPPEQPEQIALSARQRRVRRQNVLLGLALAALILYTLLNTLLDTGPLLDADLSRIEPALLYTKLAYAASGPQQALFPGKNGKPSPLRAGLSS
ncbi:MAG TPA: hypothetical protein VKT32_05645, partial [Chthonomonadaceae bacterium]|nr:hypothetical protein [Chthonomonadaceae bacterium]